MLSEGFHARLVSHDFYLRRYILNITLMVGMC